MPLLVLVKSDGERSFEFWTEGCSPGRSELGSFVSGHSLGPFQRYWKRFFFPKNA